MKALLVDNRSSRPVMRVGDHPDPEPKKQELLVKIEATALNRADLLQKSGRYPPPEGASPILGLEMAGEVLETGADADRFQPGDRVFGLLPGGGYADYCTIHQNLAMKIPEALSYEEAAAVPEVFLTAWQALSWLGELKKQERVLIHAGASGVGTAAIQIARQIFDCRILTTAGREDKLERCKELGADLAVNYKKEEFDDLIEQAEGADSVDLIVDFVGAPYWKSNLRLLAMDGRLVVLGLMGGASVDRISLVPLLRKRLTIRGSTLRNRSKKYKVELTESFRQNVLKKIESGEIRPVIDSIYDWSEVEKAHQKMAENRNIGKIILTGM